MELHGYLTGSCPLARALALMVWRLPLIGQLNPIGTVLVVSLRSSGGATTMQAGSGIPTAVVDTIQALVIIFAVSGAALANLPED